MTKPIVICLGEILFDCLADQVGKSLPEVESWTPYPGGAPANVACALTKLGTPTAFVGCVGADKVGDELVELCRNLGVNVTGIQRYDSAPTRQVYVTRTLEGDRQFAGFGDYPPDQFADAYLEADKLPSQLFAEADFLVLGTLELAYPEARKAVERALGLAQQYNVKVVLDVNWRPMFWQDTTEAQPLIEQLWQYVDFLKLAKEEAEWLFMTADAEAIAHYLKNVQGVIVTDGAREISYCINKHPGKLKAFRVEAQDTTGAGDSFVAGLVHQLCQKGITSLDDSKKVKDMVTYGCAVGALTTTKPGAIAAQPTAEEVEIFLASQV